MTSPATSSPTDRTPPGPLRLRRLTLGLTQADLSDLAGVSREQVARLEVGECEPRLRTAEHKAGHRGGLDDLLFPTARGGRRDKDNIADRVLAPVLERAEELLAERDQHPLPLGVTAHKLRHTFASILVACGRDLAYVMQQLGHTDPAFTLRVYAHVMRFSEGERGRLKALVEGVEWEEIKAGKGRNAESDTTDVALAFGVKGENPRHDAINE